MCIQTKIHYLFIKYYQLSLDNLILFTNYENTKDDNHVTCIDMEWNKVELAKRSKMKLNLVVEFTLENIQEA